MLLSETVDEHHGEDGDVPVGLDLLVVVGQVVEDGVLKQRSV